MGTKIGPLHVRRSILIQQPAHRIWQEFESQPRFRAWFGVGHELHQYEPKPDGLVDLSVEIDEAQRHFGGPIIVWKSGQELTFENNWQQPHAWPLPTFITIRLTPVYDSTIVELFHHGFERLGKDAADTYEAYESGWGINHLQALRRIVEN